MTMPSRFSCSPRSSSSLSATAAMLAFHHWILIIHLHLRLIANRADHLVTAGDDLVAIPQAAGHFDIGGAGDTGLDFSEYGLAARNDEYSLELFLERLLSCRIGARGGLGAAVLGLHVQVAALPDGERLDGNREHVLPRGRGDLGSAGKS